MSTKQTEAFIVIADGARGQYGAQHVAETIKREREEAARLGLALEWRHVPDEILADLLAGPHEEPEAYWESWGLLLDEAERWAGGELYRLEVTESGDVLAVCETLMSPEELAERLEPGDDDDRDRLARRLAKQAVDWFETATRESGEEFVRTKRGAPEWIADVVREGAHEGGATLPDDWRYATARSALAWLADTDPDEWDEDVTEWADGCVDAYNGARLAWLANCPGAVDAVDDAREQFGPADNLLDEIGRGQYELAVAIGHGIAHELRELAESMIYGEA